MEAKQPSKTRQDSPSPGRESETCETGDRSRSDLTIGPSHRAFEALENFSAELLWRAVLYLQILLLPGAISCLIFYDFL